MNNPRMNTQAGNHGRPTSNLKDENNSSGSVPCKASQENKVEEPIRTRKSRSRCVASRNRSEGANSGKKPITRSSSNKPLARSTTVYVQNDVVVNDSDYLNRIAKMTTPLHVRKKTFRSSVVPAHLKQRNASTTISRRRSISDISVANSPQSGIDGEMNLNIISTEPYSSNSKTNLLSSTMNKRLSYEGTSSSNALGCLLAEDFDEGEDKKEAKIVENVHVKDSFVKDEQKDESEMSRTEKLHYAIQRKRYDIFSTLMKEEENVINLNECYRDDKGRTLLHTAAEHECLPIILALIEKGIDINCRDNIQATPLFYAAATNSTRACACLLNNGAQINTRDEFDATPLSIALRNDNYEAAKMMLLYNADIHYKLTRSQTLLHVACEEGTLRKVNFLLNNGASITRTNGNGESCFIYAINHSAIMRKLCSFARENNLLTRALFMSDTFGKSVIHTICSKNAFKALDIILEHIPLPLNSATLFELINDQSRSNNNNTPLHFAVENNSLDIILRLVLIAEVDLTRQNADGDTALHLAIKLQNKELTEILKRYDLENKVGAIKNKRGYTPKALAKEFNAMQVFNFSSDLSLSPSALALQHKKPIHKFIRLKKDKRLFLSKKKVLDNGSLVQPLLQMNSTNPNFNIMELLRTEFIYDGLLRHAKKEWSHENILINDYLQNFHDCDDNVQKHNIAREIYRMFIKEGSTMEINFGSTIRQHIALSLQDSRVTDDLFCDVERQLEKNITDIYLRFSNTDAFQECIRNLKLNNISIMM